MSDRAPEEQPTGGRRPGLIEPVRLAVTFLTRLPVGSSQPAEPEAVAASFALFPLVGYVIGAALVIADLALARLFDAAIRSALELASIALLTGGLHLDGLADTADALAAGANRERALEIARDSSIGVYGTIALIAVLGLQWSALASLGSGRRLTALYLAPGLARWAMVALGETLDYLRPRGAGSALLSYSKGRLLKASLITLGGLVPVASIRSIAASLAGVILTVALGRFYKRWLGGVTGDLLGAAGELVATIVLLAMAAGS